MASSTAQSSTRKGSRQSGAGLPPPRAAVGEPAGAAAGAPRAADAARVRWLEQTIELQAQALRERDDTVLRLEQRLAAGARGAGGPEPADDQWLVERVVDEQQRAAGLEKQLRDALQLLRDREEQLRVRDAQLAAAAAELERAQATAARAQAERLGATVAAHVEWARSAGLYEPAQLHPERLAVLGGELAARRREVLEVARRLEDWHSALRLRHCRPGAREAGHSGSPPRGGGPAAADGHSNPLDGAFGQAGLRELRREGRRLCLGLMRRLRGECTTLTSNSLAQYLRRFQRSRADPAAFAEAFQVLKGVVRQGTGAAASQRQTGPWLRGTVDADGVMRRLDASARARALDAARELVLCHDSQPRGVRSAHPELFEELLANEHATAAVLRVCLAGDEAHTGPGSLADLSDLPSAAHGVVSPHGLPSPRQHSPAPFSASSAACDSQAAAGSHSRPPAPLERGRSLSAQHPPPRGALCGGGGMRLRRPSPHPAAQARSLTQQHAAPHSARSAASVRSSPAHHRGGHPAPQEGGAGPLRGGHPAPQSQDAYRDNRTWERSLRAPSPTSASARRAAAARRPPGAPTQPSPENSAGSRFSPPRWGPTEGPPTAAHSSIVRPSSFLPADDPLMGAGAASARYSPPRAYSAPEQRYRQEHPQHPVVGPPLASLPPRPSPRPRPRSPELADGAGAGDAPASVAVTVGGTARAGAPQPHPAEAAPPNGGPPPGSSDCRGASPPMPLPTPPAPADAPNRGESPLQREDRPPAPLPPISATAPLRPVAAWSSQPPAATASACVGAGAPVGLSEAERRSIRDQALGTGPERGPAPGPEPAADLGARRRMAEELKAWSSSLGARKDGQQQPQLQQPPPQQQEQQQQLQPPPEEQGGQRPPEHERDHECDGALQPPPPPSHPSGEEEWGEDDELTPDGHHQPTIPRFLHVNNETPEERARRKAQEAEEDRQQDERSPAASLSGDEFEDPIDFSSPDLSTSAAGRSCLGQSGRSRGRVCFAETV